MTANAAANWTRYGLERNSKLLGKLALVDAGTLFYQREYYNSTVSSSESIRQKASLC
jgi:hypothetical protein